MNRRLRVAIIGTGSRAGHMYGPLLAGLAAEVELVAVWGRSEASAKALADLLGVPGFTDLERLRREAAPEIGIVCVAGPANGEVGLMAVEAGLHVLLETPIARTLSEADAIIKAAAARGLTIEVAEQFHLRPMEQIKLKLLESGLFGQVYSSFNDFAGHAYHGVSVMRSYLGFDAEPVRVVGSTGTYALAAHLSRNAGTRGPRVERQLHGMVEFADGQIGIFHWTDVAYDSALRWWRSSRFLAEKGMGVSIGSEDGQEDRLSLLAPGGEAPLFVTVERRYERSDGGALIAVVAHTGRSDLPIVRWDNPFRPAVKGRGPQWHDDEIAVASCIMSLVRAVRDGGSASYGAMQARLDQEITLAIEHSAASGSAPVELPLPTEVRR